MIARALPLLCSVLCLRPLIAQAPADLSRGDRSIGAWVGFSPDTRDAFRPTQRRELIVAGLRAEWVLERLGPLALAATGDLIPIAIVTQNPTYITREITLPESGFVHRFKQETGNKPVFGAGASPFGLKLYVGSSRHVRFYAASAVGALWFTRDMPVPDARKFNVMVEGGAGCEIVRGSGRALALGYKFHHLSNANSAPYNPGLDSHVFYLGVARMR